MADSFGFDGSYEWYEEAYANPAGKDPIPYNYWTAQGMTVKEAESAATVQEALDDRNTALFYEKYGLEPPEDEDA